MRLLKNNMERRLISLENDGLCVFVLAPVFMSKNGIKRVTAWKEKNGEKG